MNNTMNIGFRSTPLPLYYRITDWPSPASPCCDDDYAECPDCGSGLCVFCQDACDGCGTSVF